MTRDEAMLEIARIHTQWSLEHGDDVPYVVADARPVDGESNLAVWQADRSASPEIDDPLNAEIKDIIARIKD